MLFFFNDPAPTEIYTLSLHDALPIWTQHIGGPADQPIEHWPQVLQFTLERQRTRQNSSDSHNPAASKNLQGVGARQLGFFATVRVWIRAHWATPGECLVCIPLKRQTR